MATFRDQQHFVRFCADALQWWRCVAALAARSGGRFSSVGSRKFTAVPDVPVLNSFSSSEPKKIYGYDLRVPWFRCELPFRRNRRPEVEAARVNGGCKVRPAVRLSRPRHSGRRARGGCLQISRYEKFV